MATWCTEKEKELYSLLPKPPAPYVWRKNSPRMEFELGYLVRTSVGDRGAGTYNFRVVAWATYEWLEDCDPEARDAQLKNTIENLEAINEGT